MSSEGSERPWRALCPSWTIFVFFRLRMSVDDDIISESKPVLIKVPKGDIKMTRMRAGESVRLGKLKVPGMFLR